MDQNEWNRIYNTFKQNKQRRENIPVVISWKIMWCCMPNNNTKKQNKWNISCEWHKSYEYLLRRFGLFKQDENQMYREWEIFRVRWENQIRKLANSSWNWYTKIECASVTVQLNYKSPIELCLCVQVHMWCSMGLCNVIYSFIKINWNKIAISLLCEEVNMVWTIAKPNMRFLL